MSGGETAQAGDTDPELEADGLVAETVYLCRGSVGGEEGVVDGGGEAGVVGGVEVLEGRGGEGGGVGVEDLGDLVGDGEGPAVV